MTQQATAPQKYSAKATIIDNVRFASRAEARHYLELKAMLQAGIIRDLELQPRYPLRVNDVLICTYVADFCYWDVQSRRQLVVDVKGAITPVYRLKRKLVRAIYGIEIVEVYA